MGNAIYRKGLGNGLYFDGVNDNAKIPSLINMCTSNSYYEMEFFVKNDFRIGNGRYLDSGGGASYDSWGAVYGDSSAICFEYMSYVYPLLNTNYIDLKVYCTNPGWDSVQKIKVLVNRIEGYYKIFINDVEQIVTTDYIDHRISTAFETKSQPFTFTQEIDTYSIDLYFNYFHNAWFGDHYISGTFLGAFSLKTLSDNVIRTYNFSQRSGTEIPDTTDSGANLSISGAMWVNESNARVRNIRYLKDENGFRDRAMYYKVSGGQRRVNI